ncbi:hypothetical protein [Janthinobacterium sp.]|nr:hypothetical protein [Janthinobacterium sp.]MCX7290379.1 hypothetical protein [Janthinobacterium sp.]
MSSGTFAAARAADRASCRWGSAGAASSAAMAARMVAAPSNFAMASLSR